MRRRLLTQYRTLPPALRQIISERAIAWAARLLFRFIGHKDLAFFDARYLCRNGRMLQAAKLYSQKKDGNMYPPIFDPLFECSHQPATSNGVDESVGSFYLEFCYVGMKVIASTAKASEYVEFLVDDTVLRRQSLSQSDNRTQIAFVIKRDVVAAFPNSASIKLRLDDGTFLSNQYGGFEIEIKVPHGNNTLHKEIAKRGMLGKKGNFSLTSHEMCALQEKYLRLYTRASNAFEVISGQQLFIVCGTLLGQQRASDFIPGDDDFDVGYFSSEVDPRLVKRESIDHMRALMQAGFHISINREGMPFRLAHSETGDDVFLDVTPVFGYKKNATVLRKLTRLPLPLKSWRPIEQGVMRGTKVWKPANSETFLEHYYGASWRTPDPSFSYDNRAVAPEVKTALKRTYLGLREQRELLLEINRTELKSKFMPLILRAPYPLPDHGEF